MNDTQLLESFAKERSETAFRTLVEQHLPLVLGTARRITQDSALAEDVAQTVFILLSRKASGFGSGIILSGWLYRTTRFVASRALRSEQRRRRRETHAVDMQDNDHSDPLWERIAPQLDEALGRLNETDRNAVLLRFFNQKSMRDVGIALGSNEEAARKRVTRAVEKLRTILRRRGTEISAALLVAGLSRESAQAATSELTPRIVQTVMAKAAEGLVGAGSGSVLLAEVLSAMRWFKIKMAFLAGLGVVLLIVTMPAFLRHERASDAASGSSNTNQETAVADAGVLSVRKSARKKVNTNQVSILPLRDLLITVLDAESGRPIANAQATHRFSFNEDGIQQPESARSDESGTVRLRVPTTFPGDHRMAQFEVWVKAEGYAPREIHWLSTTGSVLKAVSSNYTVRLEPGITLSGVVVDDSGAPLANVQVGGHGNNYLGYTIGKAEIRNEDFASIFLGGDTPKIVTDSAGRFQIDHFPSDLRALEIELITPEGTHTKFRTPAGKRLNADEAMEIGFDDLKRGVARLVVSRGTTIDGVVVNAAGEPIKDAEVIEATEWGNLHVLSRNHSDGDGKFQLANRPNRELIIAASAEGHASVSTIIAVQPGMETLRLQLPDALPLRGRVINESGQPVIGAGVSVVDLLNEGLGFQWSSKTDSEGRFVWSSAPTNEIGFMIYGEGLSKSVRLTASTNEHLVVLRPVKAVVHVTGKVFDAGTKAPIEHFKVKISHGKNGDMPESPKQTIDGEMGSFEVQIDGSKMPVGLREGWMLTIESDDYESQFSSLYEVSEGDQDLQFFLKPGGWVEGSVQTPTGEPAGNAQFKFGANGDWVMSTSDNLIYSSDIGTSSDNAGHFRLKKFPKTTGLVVFHESGWAVIKSSELTDRLNISLQSWGRIEGRIVQSGKRFGDEGISLSKLVWDVMDPLRVHHNAKIDREGRFVFGKVPAGEFSVRMVTSDLKNADGGLVETLQTSVVVQSGQTNYVVLGEGGRLVVARLQAPDIASPVWKGAVAILKRDVPIPEAPPRSQYITTESYRRANAAFVRDPRVVAALRELRNYPGSVDEDGTVSFENIPPGRYLMEVTLFEPRKTHRKSPGFQNLQNAAQTRVAVSVPEKTESESDTTPVSLGEITLERF